MKTEASGKDFGSGVAGRLSSRRATGVWLVALGAAMWGLDSVFINDLLKHLHPTEMILMEHLLLALYAIPVVWWGRKQFRNLSLRHWGAILFISWGGSAIASILFTAAFQYGNVNAVLILQKMQPIFAVLMARFVLREMLPPRYKWFFVLAIAGTYLLTFGFSLPDLSANSGILAGALLSIAAAILWGGSTVMGRYLLNKMTFQTVTGARFLFALPFLAVVVEWSQPHWGTLLHAAVQPGALINLLFQALFPSLLSLLIYYRGLSRTKASYATLAELAFPATGLLLNWLVLHQGIHTGQLGGFLLIWFSVFQIARFHDGQAQDRDTWLEEVV